MRPLSGWGMKLNSLRSAWMGWVSIKRTGGGEVDREEVTCCFIQARDCERQKRSNTIDQPFQCGGLPGASSWGPQGPAWMVTWRRLRPDSEGGCSQCRALFCFVIFFFFFPGEGSHFWSVGRAKASVTSLLSKLPQICQLFEERPDTQ